MAFLQEMAGLYLIAAIGFTARKTGILTKDSSRTLTQLLLYITLPALILYSLNIELSLSLFKDFLWLITMSVYILIVSSLIAAWMRKTCSLDKDRKSVYESLIILGNQGFIGYAISFILFGSQGIVYLTIFNVCYLIFIWTYGIHLFTKSKDRINWKEILVNPGILSTIGGLLFLLLPFKWPAIALSTLETVGMMTIPLSMILIGSLVANVNRHDIVRLAGSRYLWKAAGARLLLVPMLLLPFALFPIAFPVFAIAVIVSGMPSAPTICLYCEKYGGDSVFASLGVLISTILCIATVPALYLLVHFFHG